MSIILSKRLIFIVLKAMRLRLNSFHLFLRLFCHLSKDKFKITFLSGLASYSSLSLASTVSKCLASS